MSRKLAGVVHQRRVLVAHAATQRAQLAQAVERLRGPLAFIDGAFRAGQMVRRHPALLAAALALLVPLRRPALVLWSGRFFTVLEVFRALRASGRMAK